MAKKKSDSSSDPVKASQRSERRPKGRPKLSTPKPTTPIFMTIRALPAWQEWFESLSEALKKEMGLGAMKLDRTDTFDLVLARVAKSLGIPAPPSRY